jgi:hypothetical protein
MSVLACLVYACGPTCFDMISSTNYKHSGSSIFGYSQMEKLETIGQRIIVYDLVVGKTNVAESSTATRDMQLPHVIA